MARPTVTGIMPTWNVFGVGYPFLEAAYSALPLVDRMLIVDGGSTDGTLDAARRFEAAHPKVEIVEIPMPKAESPWDSMDRAIEKALALVRTEWVYEVQADEFISTTDHATMLDMLRVAHTNGFNSIRQRCYCCDWTGTNSYGGSDRDYWHVRFFRYRPDLASGAGGDCFVVTGDRQVQHFTTHNMPPELLVGVINYNFPHAVDRSCARIEQRVAHFDSRKEQFTFLPQHPIPAEPSPETMRILPPIFHGLFGMARYEARDALFRGTIEP